LAEVRALRKQEAEARRKALNVRRGKVNAQREQGWVNIGEENLGGGACVCAKYTVIVCVCVSVCVRM
jgi:hypothetical protein